MHVVVVGGSMSCQVLHAFELDKLVLVMTNPTFGEFLFRTILRPWGKRCSLCCRRPGTIPTCVGKTRSAASPDSAASDHPHVRGEN